MRSGRGGRSLARCEMRPACGSVLWCRGVVLGVLSGWSLYARQLCQAGSVGRGIERAMRTRILVWG